MILREPYSSKNLKLLDTKGVVNNVNNYITIDYSYLKSIEPLRFSTFEGADGSLNPVILYGATDSESEILPLHHPYFSFENKWVALDLRRFVTFDRATNNLTIRNESEYRLSLIRYTLTALWGVGKQSSLYSFELPHFSFASWISDNLGHKFGLDLGDKVRLRTLAALYYTRLFSNERDSEELNLLLIRTKKDLIVPELLKEIYEIAEDMENIEDFCRLCYEVTGNIRLKGLDYVVLSNIVSGNWLGNEGKALSLLALEHPPTWITLCYIALTQRSFKRSFVTTVVEKHGRRGNDQDFVRSVDIITKNQLQEI